MTNARRRFIIRINLQEKLVLKCTFPWPSDVAGHLASIDKGTRGSAGRKCPHTASKPLRIHKVFSAAFSLSASISAPAELLRIGQPWIFEGFLFFWTQAGCRPPRRKGQKAPKRLTCPTHGFPARRWLIFSDVHAAGENDQKFICACGRKLCEAFCRSGKAVSLRSGGFCVKKN